MGLGRRFWPETSGSSAACLHWRGHGTETLLAPPVTASESATNQSRQWNACAGTQGAKRLPCSGTLQASIHPQAWLLISHSAPRLCEQSHWRQHVSCSTEYNTRPKDSTHLLSQTQHGREICRLTRGQGACHQFQQRAQAHAPPSATSAAYQQLEELPELQTGSAPASGPLSGSGFDSSSMAVGNASGTTELELSS